MCATFFTAKRPCERSARDTSSTTGIATRGSRLVRSSAARWMRTAPRWARSTSDGSIAARARGPAICRATPREDPGAAVSTSCSSASCRVATAASSRVAAWSDGSLDSRSNNARVVSIWQHYIRGTGSSPVRQRQPHKVTRCNEPTPTRRHGALCGRRPAKDRLERGHGRARRLRARAHGLGGCRRHWRAARRSDRTDSEKLPRSLGDQTYFAL